MQQNYDLEKLIITGNHKQQLNRALFTEKFSDLDLGQNDMSLSRHRTSLTQVQVKYPMTLVYAALAYGKSFPLI